MTQGRFSDRTDWWSAIERLPRPRVAVFETLDEDSGKGACIGDVHGAILKAFGCEGVITNGSVRDVPGLKKLGLPVFAKSFTVSHSFMHILDFGTPVEIFGLPVSQGIFSMWTVMGCSTFRSGSLPSSPRLRNVSAEKINPSLNFVNLPIFLPKSCNRLLGKTSRIAVNQFGANFLFLNSGILLVLEDDYSMSCVA